MYVKERFKLSQTVINKLKAQKPLFGFPESGFGEFIFYRTYSRAKSNGQQEMWVDCVIRVVEGVMSIRKDHYVRNCIFWDEENMQAFAANFAQSMFDMKWLPPGRGLWAMGTEYVYQRGAMPLYNCAYTTVRVMSREVPWIMDVLMNGVGVGFGPERDDSLALKIPCHDNVSTYVIPDSREGWVESVRLLLESYEKGTGKVHFDYSLIRPAGIPIKGFGGTASGPEPLKQLHDQIRKFCNEYIAGHTDSVRLKADIVNAVGCCVVAGNVRRSAEIAIGKIDDPTFIDLKNYAVNPERESIGWMSNNSVILEKPEDFDRLGEIAKRVIEIGEPGYLNKMNFPYGRLRVGKLDDVPMDKAVGLNPCGEIPLEDYEVCNIAETLPTRCANVNEWYEACTYASFYCSTVSLLPTHRQETNKVVARNRRIGIGIIDFTGWRHSEGIHAITKYMRTGYKIIRKVNEVLAAEAGVPASIRVTTIKPGGTVPKMAGCTSGIGYPTFRYTVRRVRVGKQAPICKLLIAANVPHEPDYYSQNTLVFEFPIVQGPAKPASEVTLWEQATNLALIQREWSDNAVSNTLYFKPRWILRSDSYYTREKLVGAIEDIDEFFCEVLQSDTSWDVLSALDVVNEKKYVFEDENVQLKIKIEEVNEDCYRIREWCYNPKHEEDDIESVLGFLAPITKSVSMLPHTSEGVYKQMPESGCTASEYHEKVRNITPIDWSEFTGGDGEDTRYCDGDQCEIPNI